jgi:hypothetical protein
MPAAKRPVGNAIAGVPEIGCDAMVDDISQHVNPPALLDKPEGIAAKLEIVAPLINTVRTVAFDIDSTPHVGDELIECR